MFFIGPGPITWAYIPEITQDKATSIATMTNWITSGSLTLISGITAQMFAPYWTIWFFGLASLCATYFVHAYVLETKNKTFKEIEEMFDRSPYKYREVKNVEMNNKDWIDLMKN
jgi:hypothetical protein